MSKFLKFVLTFTFICVMGLIVLFVSGVPVPGTDAGFIVFITFLVACVVAGVIASYPTGGR